MGAVIGCYLILTLMYNILGCGAEECFKTVKARRDHKVVFEGRSLLLSCEVQHCGLNGWTGGWGVITDTFSLLQPSSRFDIYNESLSISNTRLNINFISANISDTGQYQCRINWGENSNSNGHVTYVNVTANRYPQERSERVVLLRVLVYVCACLSIPLAWALAKCLSHPAAPPVPPRSYSASPQRGRPRGELVYAALALENVERPNPNLQNAQEQPVVYSSLRL